MISTEEKEQRQPEALKTPEEKFQARLSHPSSPFPSAIPAVLIHRTGNPTNRWHLGRRADKLAPTCRSTKSFQSRPASLAKSPAGWKCPRNLPSVSFPRGSTAPAPSSPGCRCAGGSSWELGAGGGCLRVLNGQSRLGTNGEMLLSVSAQRFGLEGLQLGVCERVFVGPHRTSICLWKNELSSSCLLSLPAKVGVCPLRKLLSLTR